MKKREFLKSGLGLAGLSLLDPSRSITAFAEIPPFELPKLGYGYADMEPLIDARTMELHYSKHHAAYVEKLNAELAKGAFTYKSLEDLISKYAGGNKTIRNHGGGHFNHNLMWRTLTKPGTSKIPTDLEIELIINFESVEGFMVNFQQTAVDRFGSGWAWLCKRPDGTLFITSTANQDNPLMKIDGIVQGKPLVGIDIWEHAYYLKHFNNRTAYVESFYNLINWNEVERIRKEK